MDEYDRLIVVLLFCYSILVSDGHSSIFCLGSKDFIIQSSMVRSYAPYDKTKQRSQAGRKKFAKERTATEWDVRIDCDSTYADEIVENLKKATAILDYALVSGIEQADSEVLTGGSKNNHVHIALIFKYELRRDQVLATVRGLLKKPDEYCVPRNKKFTYAGWYMHHTKIDWKMVVEPPVRYEFGVLPEDDDSEYNVKAIRRLFLKFGCDDVSNQELLKLKFARYLTQ